MPRFRFVLSRSVRNFLLVAGIVILLGLLERFSVLDAPKGVIVRILSPLTTLSNRIGSGAGKRIGLGQNGEMNSEELRKERDWLLSELVRLKEVERENALLREELGVGPPDEMPRIAARVIARDPSGIGHGIVINRGRGDGVEEDNLVALPGRILVGKVRRISEHTAHIVLIDDPESRIEARFQTSRATGILKGDFGLTLRVDLIPRDTLVREGDVVLSAGLDGTPAGLLIGTVSSVERGDAELFYTARITPAANLQWIEEVFVFPSHDLE